MKKILSLVLLALMIFAVAACGKKSGSDETSAQDTSDAAPVATHVHFAVGGASEYALVYSKKDMTDSAEDIVLDFRVLLRSALPKSSFTINKFGNSTEVEETEKEIVIGVTNRAATAELVASVPAECFGIEVTEDKIVIYAERERVLTSALQYFADNYLKADADGNINIPIGRYVSEAQTYSVSPVISSADGFSTKHTKLYDIPAIGANRIMQGGCSDGSYMYFCMINSGSPQYAYVCKYDLKTNKLVKTSELLPTDHSNDMTYNSKTNEIIVLHNSPRNAMLTMLDPETLEIKRTMTVMFNMFCIDYQPERNAYVIGISGGQNFSILDENFRVHRDYIPLGTTRFEVQSTGYTTQGVVCDKEYIYFVQYKENVVMVYDWNGNFVNRIPLSIPSNTEPENISIVDDYFYIACNNSSWTGGELYKVALVPPEK